MEDWMKIVAALALGAMVIFLLPHAKAMLQNSPKAQKGDWGAVILPIAFVVLFVIFLISLV